MKLLNEKTNKIIIKLASILTNLFLIDIPLLIFIFVSKFFIQDLYIGEQQESVSFSAIFILALPVILYIILRILLFIKNKAVKITVNILGLLLLPVSVLFYLYCFSAFIFGGMITSVPLTETPPVSEYSTKVKELTKKEYRIKHFPLNIPEKAQNYYFYVDGGGLHGYCINYLKFNTDDKYLDNVIKQNKDKMYKQLPLIKISEHYKDFDLIGDIPITNKNKYTAYILKNENNDSFYTSGFLISKERNEIIYFYANYNLEINYKNKLS